MVEAQPTLMPGDVLPAGDAMASNNQPHCDDDEEEDVAQPSKEQNGTPAGARGHLQVETKTEGTLSNSPDEGRQEDSEVVQYVDVRTKVMGRQAELEELRKRSEVKGRKAAFNSDSPLATTSTLASFFQKQKQMKQQVRQNRLGAISSLNQYRSKETETPKSARASSTPRHELAGKSSYSGMEDFFLKQRQMDKEWKASKEKAFHKLHIYRQEHIHNNNKQDSKEQENSMPADVTSNEVAARDDQMIFDSLINVHAELKQFFTVQLGEVESGEERENEEQQEETVPCNEVADEEEPGVVEEEKDDGKKEDFMANEQTNENLEKQSARTEPDETGGVYLVPANSIPAEDKDDMDDEAEAEPAEDHDAAVLLDELLEVSGEVFDPEQEVVIDQQGIDAAAVGQAVVTDVGVRLPAKSGLADSSVSSMGSTTQSEEQLSPEMASLSSGVPPRFTLQRKVDIEEHETRREQYLPNLHGSLAPCEQCLFWASEKEKTQFEEAGRSLRIMLCRGGCRRNCSVFPREDNEPPVRLCQRCYHNTHRNKIQEGKNLP